MKLLEARGVIGKLNVKLRACVSFGFHTPEDTEQLKTRPLQWTASFT